VAAERIPSLKTLHDIVSAAHSGVCTTDYWLARYTRHDRDSRRGRSHNRPLLSLPAPTGTCWCRFWKDVGIVAGVTIFVLIAHLLEMLIWAMVFDFCGEFTQFATAFYHSSMNYTTLGYGDVVMSASWKLFGPLEAANGMLMFGVSTAMIFAVIQGLIQIRFRDAET